MIIPLSPLQPYFTWLAQFLWNQREANHSVLFPVFPISWKTGSSPGITVGTGATDDEEVGRRGVGGRCCIVGVRVAILEWFSVRQKEKWSDARLFISLVKNTTDDEAHVMHGGIPCVGIYVIESFRNYDGIASWTVGRLEFGLESGWLWHRDMDILLIFTRPAWKTNELKYMQHTIHTYIQTSNW